MSLIEATVLGLIQGLTEFLPISSSGHLVLAQHLFGLGGAENLTFVVLLHGATLIAVILSFRADLVRMARGIVHDRTQRRLAALLVLAMIPTGIIGLAIRHVIEQAFDRPIAVGVMLIVTGTILYVAPRLRRPTVAFEGIGLRQATWIGISQGIAALPGISRSGITISTGIVSGVEAEAAARFSFLLSILAILAAMVLNVPEIGALDRGNVTASSLGAGMVAAWAAGMVSIRWLMRVARRGRFDGFAFYCWGVGGLTILVLLWQRFRIA